MKITNEEFTDAKFLTAEEKYKISKHFARFVKNGFQRKDFVKRVYEHLHLHCGFIAHYNIDGFYQEYFNGNNHDLRRFVEAFLQINFVPYGNQYNSSNIDYEPYKDVNTKLADILLDNNILARFE